MQDNGSNIVILYLVSTAIILVLIALVAVFVVVYQRRVMAQQSRMQEIQAEAQQQKMQAIVLTEEGERMRIARDLHDEVGAILSAVKMAIKLAERKAGDGMAGPMQEATTMLDTAIGAVRAISHDLLPPSLETLGLARALANYAETVAQLSEIPFDCTYNAQLQHLPIRTALALYRVVQELANNSLKHAQATARSLQIHCDAMQLHIRFQDNGIGCDLEAVLAAHRGLGLDGMASRVESLGGSLQLSSSLGNGFFAELTMPMPYK